MPKFKICIPKDGTSKDRLENLRKIAKHFDGDRAVEQFGIGSGQFKKLYKAATGKHFGEEIPSVEQLKLFNTQVHSFTKRLKLGQLGGAESLFYLPKELTWIL